MEAVIAQIDQCFLLGELMPFSDRLEDRLYRELIRQSNRSVIEKIHAAEDQKKDYRAYIENWVHEIKAPITSISLICKNHKSEVTRSIRSENSKIENLVEDNGIGIPKEEIPRIFEKNFTGTNGRTHERSTGMGLYLCEKLCRKLGIAISADAQETVGTKIMLEFSVCSFLVPEELQVTPCQ